VNEALTLGVSGAYVAPHVYQDGGEDETAARVFSIGGYGRVAGGASRLDFGVSTGRERFETRRSITDGVDFASSSSEYDGRSLGGQVEYGYTFGLGGGVDLEAETGLQFYRQNLEAIQEAGAGVLNLAIPERTIESRRSLLGARLRKTIARASGTEIVFEGRGAWLHEFAGRADLPARFEGDLTTDGFRLPAPGRLKNNGLFGAGIYANTRGGLRFFADVIFESGPASRMSGSVGVGRRW
jgi:outer membrane autotransporter protein